MPDSCSHPLASRGRASPGPDSRAQRLAAFTDWASQHITGDEKGEAHIFLDRLFQAFGQPGCLDVGGQPEFRIKKGKESTGDTSFADDVWRPNVLIQMKKRGEPLARHLRQRLDRSFCSASPYQVLFASHVGTRL